MHSESEGLGFTIFYDENNELHAVVKTNSTVYNVTYPLPTAANDTVRSFIMTWTPEKLKLFEGTALLQSDSGTAYGSSLQNTRILAQEYILIFSQYHFGSASYTFGEFFNFKIWRYALDENKDKDEFQVDMTCKLVLNLVVKTKLAKRYEIST